MDQSRPSNESWELDREEITHVIEQHPVRLAILFGSQTSGTATRQSDVDIAVAFEDDLTAVERLNARIELVVSLVETVGTDEIDVADLEVIQPSVGRAAIETGDVLVDDQPLLEVLRERFERQYTVGSHDERMQRFDSLLDRLEDCV